MRSVCLLAMAGTRCADDLWLRAGKVWTGDPERPWAESVPVCGNRIAAAGTDKAVGAAAKDAMSIDLRGRLTIPGFIDAHMHFLGGSLGLRQMDLNGIYTLAEMQKVVADFANKHPGTGWLHGRGWGVRMPAGGPAAAKGGPGCRGERPGGRGEEDDR